MKEAPWRLFLLSWICAAALAGLPAASAAQDVAVRLPDGQVVVPSSNAELQQLVLFLIANGDPKTAAAAVRDWQPGHPDHPVRVAYVDGLIAAAAGDDPQAVRIWRAILAQRPDLELVRVQLTRALYRLGNDKGARFQAEQLIASGVDDRLGGEVQGLLRRMNARRPLTFGAWLSVLPSSNINGGSERSTVALGPLVGVIPKSQRRQSGIGLEIGGFAGWRHALGDADALVASAEAKVQHYGRIDRTDLALDASAGIERRLGWGRILPAVTAGARTIDGDTSYRYVGLSMETTARLSDRWRLYAAPRFRVEEFPNGVADDGIWIDLPLQFDYFHGPDSFTRLIAGVSAARRDLDRFSYDEIRLGLGHYRELPAGVTLYVEGVLARRDYRDLYPGLSEARHDERATLSATVTKRDLVIAGFAPRLGLTLERNRSNAAFNDTTRHEIDLRFVRDF